jgi:hypothetical protein
MTDLGTLAVDVTAGLSRARLVARGAGVHALMP